jgi:hypothetical protein
MDWWGYRRGEILYFTAIGRGVESRTLQCRQRNMQLQYVKQKQAPWLLVRKHSIPTELPPRTAELFPNYAAECCCVSSRTDYYGSQFRISRPEPLLFAQVAPQFFTRDSGSRSRHPPLKKSGRTGNRARDLWICNHKLWPLDRRGGPSPWNTSPISV